MVLFVLFSERMLLVLIWAPKKLTSAEVADKVLPYTRICADRSRLGALTLKSTRPPVGQDGDEKVVGRCSQVVPLNVLQVGRSWLSQDRRVGQDNRTTLSEA